MPGQRKRYSAELKAKVALEAIKCQKTTNEIAAEYGVHPSQISQWKKQLLDELPQFFSKQEKDRGKTEAEIEDDLLSTPLLLRDYGAQLSTRSYICRIMQTFL